MGCGASKNLVCDYPQNDFPYKPGCVESHNLRRYPPDCHEDFDDETECCCSSRNSSWCARGRGTESKNERSPVEVNHTSCLKCSSKNEKIDSLDEHHRVRSETPRNRCCKSSCRKQTSPTKTLTRPHRSWSPEQIHYLDQSKYLSDANVIPGTTVAPLTVDGQNKGCQVLFNNEEATVESETYVSQDQAGVTYLINRHNIRRPEKPDCQSQGELFITITQKLPIGVESPQKQTVYQQQYAQLLETQYGDEQKLQSGQLNEVSHYIAEDEREKSSTLRYIYMGTKRKPRSKNSCAKRHSRSPVIKRRSICRSKSTCCHKKQKQLVNAQEYCQYCHSPLKRGAIVRPYIQEPLTVSSPSQGRTKPRSTTDSPRASEESLHLNTEPLMAQTVISPDIRNPLVSSIGKETRHLRESTPNQNYAYQKTNNSAHDLYRKLQVDNSIMNWVDGCPRIRRNKSDHIHHTKSQSDLKIVHGIQSPLLQQYCALEPTYSESSSPNLCDLPQAYDVSLSENEQELDLQRKLPERQRTVRYIAEFVISNPSIAIEELQFSPSVQNAELVQIPSPTFKGLSSTISPLSSSSKELIEQNLLQNRLCDPEQKIQISDGKSAQRIVHRLKMKIRPRRSCRKCTCVSELPQINNQLANPEVAVPSIAVDKRFEPENCQIDCLKLHTRIAVSNMFVRSNITPDTTDSSNSFLLEKLNTTSETDTHSTQERFLPPIKGKRSKNPSIRSKNRSNVESINASKKNVSKKENSSQINLPKITNQKIGHRQQTKNSKRHTKCLETV